MAWVMPVVVALPLAGAALTVPMSRVSRTMRDVVLTAICALCAAGVVALVSPVIGGEIPHLQLVQITPGIWLDFRADALGVLFALTVAFMWLLAVPYSSGYMADEHRQARYFSFLMMALAWTAGVAFAGNLLTLLVFYELFSVLTYPLVVHEQTSEAMAAGTKYIVYILIGGGLVLLAILITYFIAGNGDFGGGTLLTLEAGRTVLIAVFWCFVAGFGVKAAIVPLHGWVPDAHPAAPAPFSAVLSGVMVAAGSFGILRVLYHVFGAGLLAELDVTRWLGYLAAATILLAAIIALTQDDIKRRLAYSTISQMGYVLLGAALLGLEATQGSLVHIANHAFMKGTLFLCAGIFIKRLGIRKVSRMAGIGKRVPLTMAAFTVASLAMIGTPPLSGFVSKWYLGMGIVEAGQPLYLIVLLLGALLAAGYLLPIVYSAYFKRPAVSETTAPGGASEAEETRGSGGSGETSETGTASDASEKEPPGGGRRRLEAPPSMLVPALAGAIITVLLGVLAWLPGLPLSLARMVAEAVIG